MSQPTRRGRPRPQNVIARDQQIYNLLRERPRSKVELVESTHLTPEQVYLVLRRLYLDGKARRLENNDHHVNVWIAT